ncbi:hypothetical protein EMIT053CA3_150137 [Pseudomonas donghuensis]
MWISTSSFKPPVLLLLCEPGLHRTLMRRIRPVLACFWVNWRNALFCDSLGDR